MENSRFLSSCSIIWGDYEVKQEAWPFCTCLLERVFLSCSRRYLFDSSLVVMTGWDTSVESSSAKSVSMSASWINMPSFKSTLMTDEAELPSAPSCGRGSEVEKSDSSSGAVILWLWMCRFDSEGDGFNGGMTRREPGDVVGIPVIGWLGREIVRERGSYDMNSIEMMLKLMLILIKSNDTKNHY